MRTRGWAANHLGYWEGGAEGEAVKEIGEDGWRARFSFDLVEQKGEYDAELCSTGQVRFERRTGAGTDAQWKRVPRREVLERLLPRTKIADRVELYETT